MAPVTEVKNLVAQLRSGKAPGEDPLPPDAIKNNLDFWAHTLALLFTCINTMNEHKGLGAHDLSPYTVLYIKRVKRMTLPIINQLAFSIQSANFMQDGKVHKFMDLYIYGNSSTGWNKKTYLKKSKLDLGKDNPPSTNA